MQPPVPAVPPSTKDPNKATQLIIIIVFNDWRKIIKLRRFIVGTSARGIIQKQKDILFSEHP